MLDWSALIPIFVLFSVYFLFAVVLLRDKQ